MMPDLRSDLHWFAASLLFRGCFENQADAEPSLWEESIRLVRAFNVEDAQERAELLGKSLEVAYVTNEGRNLSWIFFRVESVFQIEGNILGDGLEVFSRFLRHDEVVSLLAPFDE